MLIGACAARTAEALPFKSHRSRRRPPRIAKCWRAPAKSVSRSFEPGTPYGAAAGAQSPAQRLAADRVPEAKILLLPLRILAILLEERSRCLRIGGRHRRVRRARRQDNRQGQNS